MGFEDEEDQDSPGIGLKVTIAAFFSFFVIVLFIIIIHFYVKYLQRRQERRRYQDILHRITTQIAPIDIESLVSPNNSGLDPSILASLPKLLYKQTHRFSQGETVECPVCLGPIEEDATIRVLPNCKHMFHVDCVDMWFNSHNTCPICRVAAEPMVREVEVGDVPRPQVVQVQHTAPPVEEDGGVLSQDANELEEVGCSGLRIASFIGRERTLRNQNSEGSNLEEIEKALS